MSRALTAKTTLDHLRKDAKRWLKAVRAGDPAARARLKSAWPAAPAEPGLRDIQQALAREYGQENWIALKAALDDLALARKGRDEQIELALRSGWDGDVRAARRLLQRRPELAQASLHMAAICGDLSEVERRLAKESVDARAGPLGWTPLTCVTYGRLDETSAVAIAKRLLEAGADPNAGFNDGWDSPFKVLTGAIRLGEGARPSHAQVDELVALLVEAGADPFDPQALYNVSIVGDDTDWYDRLWGYCAKGGVLDRWRQPTLGLGGKKGLTAIDYLLCNAIGQWQPGRAEWLLEHGADPNVQHWEMDQSLHLMAQLSGLRELTTLLERYGARPAVLNDVQALQAASMSGDLEAIRQLLAKDPSLIERPEALHYTVGRGNLAAFDLLVSLGARTDHLEHDGISPLHRAVQTGSIELAQRLLDRGADVDLRERRWHGTPMSWAVVLNQPHMADFLAPFSHDVRPFAYQARLERLEAALTDQPWRANERLPGDGPTPLYCLPDDEEMAVEVARILLAHGADPTVRSDKGQTPADAARVRGLDDAAALMDCRHAR